MSTPGRRSSGTVERSDCVVIGGGPAGSTFAGLVKKYAPRVRVTLLEQARFPRYHIGESTIPAANNVLRDLGVSERLERSGFVRKMGIVFVWGDDRTPWNADFLLLRTVHEAGRGADIIDVTGQQFQDLQGRPEHYEVPFSAFNVERAEFDHILLTRARELGADVREGTRVTGVHRARSGAVEGVSFRDDAGREGRIDTRFVLDASGLSSLITRGEREHDPEMNNFAVYGYLAGADWKVTFNGTRDRSTVFIAAVDNGWIWYFPIRQDIMSVGAVTRREHFVDRLAHVDLEEFWWEMIRSCPEVSPLVKHARVRTDVLPGGRRVAASQDWSSWARSPIGDGWAAAGDAAIFVDPILSSGVTLAIQSAHRAAYTFLTARRLPRALRPALWRAYADYIRGEYGAFFTLARYFYGNNRAASSWWWESQRVVNRSGLLRLADRQSFTMATAGFFPMPRAIGREVVGELVARLAGARADMQNVFRDSGLPPRRQLARCRYDVLASFRLDLRTEPTLGGLPPGELDIYHDLVTDDGRFAHRLAAVPCRILPELAPLVDAIATHRDVPALLAAGSSLLGSEFGPAERVREAVLDVVGVAAMKGFLRLRPDGRPAV